MKEFFMLINGVATKFTYFAGFTAFTKNTPNGNL